MNYPPLFVYGGHFLTDRPVAFTDFVKRLDLSGIGRKVGVAVLFYVLPLVFALAPASHRRW